MAQKSDEVRNGKNHSVGRIDHFYCKELYPILALTLSNLVPSCVGCNEAGGKGTEDMLARKVVLPYLLPHSHGIEFKLNLTGASSVTNDEELADAVSIDVFYPIAALKNNNVVFGLETLYNEHVQKEEAIRIHRVACKYAATPYKAYVDKTIKPTGIKIPLDRVFINKLGVSRRERYFPNYKDSCFLMSIFRHSVEKASNGKIKLNHLK